MRFLVPINGRYISIWSFTLSPVSLSAQSTTTWTIAHKSPVKSHDAPEAHSVSLWPHCPGSAQSTEAQGCLVHSERTCTQFARRTDLLLHVVNKVNSSFFTSKMIIDMILT